MSSHASANRSNTPAAARSAFFTSLRVTLPRVARIPPFRQRNRPVGPQVDDDFPGTYKSMDMTRLVVLRIDLEPNGADPDGAHQQKV
jgi:hypothetical protein